MVHRALLLTACLFASPALAGDDWPQFRGPDGQGHSEATGLPLNWSETEHVAWKTAIPGQGWSSPVVNADRVWMTTATQDGCSLRAVAVDRRTGVLVHDKEIFHRDAAIEKHATNSYASPTPILEGDRVWVHFGTMGTACLEEPTADILWTSQEFQFDHEVGPAARRRCSRT